VNSAFNAGGEFWAATYGGKLNAGSFILFLWKFMQGRNGKVFLVADGHQARKANAGKDRLAPLNNQLDLHALPPSAPDFNPNGLAWRHLKNNGISKKPQMENEFLRKRVEQDPFAI
jgi:transposase